MGAILWSQVVGEYPLLLLTGEMQIPPPQKKRTKSWAIRKTSYNIPWVQVVVTDILQEDHTNPAEFVSKADHGL